MEFVVQPDTNGDDCNCYMYGHFQLNKERVLEFLVDILDNAATPILGKLKENINHTNAGYYL